jgi:hypothetical protein
VIHDRVSSAHLSQTAILPRKASANRSLGDSSGNTKNSHEWPRHLAQFSRAMMFPISPSPPAPITTCRFALTPATAPLKLARNRAPPPVACDIHNGKCIERTLLAEVRCHGGRARLPRLVPNARETPSSLAQRDERCVSPRRTAHLLLCPQGDAITPTREARLHRALSPQWRDAGRIAGSALVDLEQCRGGRELLLASGASSLQCARLQVPMERLGLSAVARFLEDGMLLLVCSRSALEGASAGTVMCEANGERWRGLNECALKERCGDRHARGEVWGMRIMNFATGSLEVHKDATHLMVGPSHRTDRPALASQDEISSQEGRAGAVRPSCVVSVRGEAMSRWRSSLESALHLRILRHRQNFFPRAEQELVRCISQLLTKLRTGRPAQ